MRPSQWSAPASPRSVAEWFDPALEELYEAALWYAEESGETLGLRFLTEVQRAAELVTRDPGIGAKFDPALARFGVRRFGLSRVASRTRCTSRPIPGSPSWHLPINAVGLATGLTDLQWVSSRAGDGRRYWARSVGGQVATNTSPVNGVPAAAAALPAPHRRGGHAVAPVFCGVPSGLLNRSLHSTASRGAGGAALRRRFSETVDEVQRLLAMVGDGDHERVRTKPIQQLVRKAWDLKPP